MKLTESMLRKIIKEELKKVLNENDEKYFLIYDDGRKIGPYDTLEMAQDASDETVQHIESTSGRIYDKNQEFEQGYF